VYLCGGKEKVLVLLSVSVTLSIPSIWKEDFCCVCTVEKRRSAVSVTLSVANILNSLSPSLLWTCLNMPARRRVKLRLQEKRYISEIPLSLVMQGSSVPGASTNSEIAVQHSSSNRSNRLCSQKDEGPAWRQPGKMYRARLLAQDQAEGGGKTLNISNDCAIESYYHVAGKCQNQFLNHRVNTKEEFIEAYLVGSRLCKFLGEILPTHPQYFSSDPKLRHLRMVSQTHFFGLLPYLDKLEGVIDKDEHRQYISQVLGTPVGTHDDAADPNDDGEDVEEKKDEDNALTPHRQEQENYVLCGLLPTKLFMFGTCCAFPG
jgi:hypothetical protein